MTKRRMGQKRMGTTALSTSAQRAYLSRNHKGSKDSILGDCWGIFYRPDPLPNEETMMHRSNLPIRNNMLQHVPLIFSSRNFL